MERTELFHKFQELGFLESSLIDLINIHKDNDFNDYNRYYFIDLVKELKPYYLSYVWIGNKRDVINIFFDLTNLSDNQRLIDGMDLRDNLINFLIEYKTKYGLRENDARNILISEMLEILEKTDVVLANTIFTIKQLCTLDSDNEFALVNMLNKSFDLIAYDLLQYEKEKEIASR